MENDCRNCPFNSKAVGTLNENSFDKLNSNHAIVGFSKGNTIIKQGNFSTNIAFLRTGMAKVHITGPYHEQIVKLVKAPTYLGLPTTFGNKINQYSVTAITDANVCFIDMDVFRNLLKENERFSYEIILELCNNELDSFHRCANRTQKMIRGNMADAILNFSNNIFMSDKFTLPLSQTEFANLVDTSRESVSRVFAEFDRDGIIKIKGKELQILNKKSLELISQNG